MSMQRFVGQSVWISGAATGLGRAAAELFVREGGNVTLVDIDGDAGEACREELVGFGTAPIFVRCDVSDEQQVAAAVEAAIAHWGQLDIAFNNAGIQIENSALADSNTEVFDRLLSVNTRSVYLCMKYQIRHMLQQGGGHIINTASAAALMASPMRCGYAASKHAVLGLTRTAAVEYGRQNIHINAICPSVVETEMYSRAMAENPDSRAAIEAAIPVGRAGKPEEIAAAVAFLATEEARFIHGHGLAVDGGLLAI